MLLVAAVTEVVVTYGCPMTLLMKHATTGLSDSHACAVLQPSAPGLPQQKHQSGGVDIVASELRRERGPPLELACPSLARLPARLLPH